MTSYVRKGEVLGRFCTYYESLSKIVRDWLRQWREVSKEMMGSWRHPWMWVITILFWLSFCFALLCPLVSLELQKRTLADARLNQVFNL